MTVGSGIVRAARRPAGWRAPGPRPRVPAPGSESWPAVGEDLCHLAGDFRILQKVRGHRWSLDDLVTAAIAADTWAEPPRRVLDLGCGIGAVLLLLAWRFPRARLVGVEAQPENARLARRSIRWNGVEDRAEVVTGDLRDATWRRTGERYDLVTGTPPYLPPRAATRPSRAEQPGCHLELRGGVEEYLRAAAENLAVGGRLVLCHSDAERVDRAADTAGLAVARRRRVVPRLGKPVLFHVFELEPRFGVSPIDAPPLVVRDERRRWTPDFLRLREQMGMPPPSPENVEGRRA